jgi:hypothetical protein
MVERELRAGRLREPDRVPTPGEARILADDVLEQAARHADGGVPEREQPPRGLFDEDRPAPFLDQLDQAVGGVQPELHPESVSEHTFAVQIRHYKCEWTDSDRQTELTAKPERRL